LEVEKEPKSSSSAARDSHMPPLHSDFDRYSLDLSLFYPFPSSFFLIYWVEVEVSLKTTKVPFKPTAAAATEALALD